MATRAMPPFKPWTEISERSLTFRPANLREQMIYQGAHGSLINIWDSAIEDGVVFNRFRDANRLRPFAALWPYVP